MKVDGKVAIITGGARGIGRAQAEAILAKGGKVCITDILQEEGQKTASELQSKYGQERVTFIHCDVTKESELKGVFSSCKNAFGQIDIVVNNAGGVRETDWEQTLQLNLVSAYRGTDLAFEFMGRDKGGAGGVVISLASIAGLIPFAAMPSYTAAKHGVVGMTKALGTPEHYAEKGVRVNCICPWFVDTPLASGDMLTASTFPAIMRKFYKDNEHTLIKPETIATATIELIEDDSKNGSVLEVQQDSAFVYVDYRRLPETAE